MNTSTSAREFVEALRSRTPIDTMGLCARIIRGKTARDFETLSDDPERLIVMTLGADGLQKFLQCETDRDMLVAIGYEPTYIKRKVEEGNIFKLVVFPASEANAHLADWEGVVKAVEISYSPEIAKCIKRALPRLKLLPTPANQGWHIKQFERWERKVGYDFSEVDKEGITNPNYMTVERFLSRRKGVRRVRAFLYFTLHLRELYGGDGYTYDINGTRGMTEYFCPNIKIADIKGLETIELNIN